jgi:nitrite reductase (NADH) large subunit
MKDSRNMVTFVATAMMAASSYMAPAHAFAPSGLFGARVSAPTAASSKVEDVTCTSKCHRVMQMALNGDVNGSSDEKKRIVVIGNGMVGQRFMENMIDREKEAGTEKCILTTFCEEPRAAYNRVKLTSYFETLDPSALTMTSEFDEEGATPWYKENNVELLVGDKAVGIDVEAKTVTGANGKVIPYDVAVFATGSYPFVPPIPGKQRPGVFVYRTIEDLENMLAYVKDNGVTSAAVIGGGLLGLEAAKAVHDMGVESHIIEFAPILMCRQIDQGGHNALVGTIEEMGLKVHCGARTAAFVGEDGSTDSDNMTPVAALSFSNEEEGWEDLPVQMVVVSAGIKPRDELARDSGIAVGERGGIVVDEFMKTSAEDVYAIGEIALYNNFIYGLILPGYDMAKVAAAKVAASLGIGGTPEDETLPKFTGADLSTKLKLLGSDVASFGENQPPADDKDVSELVWNDPINSIYRKIIFNKAGTKVRGGILVGDAGDYTKLHRLFQTGEELDPAASATLLPPPSALVQGGGAVEEEVSDDPNFQVCSCNDVNRGQVVATIQDLGVEGATLGAVKKCSKAGTGCGGCEPLVKTILAQELEKMGGSLSNNLCEHFDLSRPELMALVRTDADPDSVNSFEKILHKHGHGDGCEVCKPAVGNILASLYNDVIIDEGRDGLQDTNDRAMANMQRGGTYSVVPRVPGGELSPEQLIAMGETARKFNLYTKVTGAQRVDLFGAAKHDLPEIWEMLGEAGLESGHAYGKALRTVKSCVGSTWCRYGVQDAVSMAVRVENRYKGIRSPHKMKGGVSGCVRECAEATGKDFGFIATEHGYNLYLGGNGGASPVHAQLFGTDLDEDTAILYLDRYLMYYILTADRLERTARWQEKLPSGKNGGGPIEHLREVIIDDSLGLCEEFDRRMQLLVDTYHDEWAEVVNDPERRKKFKQFVNTDETIDRDAMIEFIDMRGQNRPADWPADGQPGTMWQAPTEDVFARSEKSWIQVGNVKDFSSNVGSAILYGDTQLAVFNNAQRGEWYCTQNMCPHKQAFVLSQGIMGDAAGTPKVACPLHKKNFDLGNGAEIGGDLKIITFPVKIEGDAVMVELPSIVEVDAILGTNGLRVEKSDCIDTVGDAIKVPLKSKKMQEDIAESLAREQKTKKASTT